MYSLISYAKRRATKKNESCNQLFAAKHREQPNMIGTCVCKHMRTICGGEAENQCRLGVFFWLCRKIKLPFEHTHIFLGLGINFG